MLGALSACQTRSGPFCAIAQPQRLSAATVNALTGKKLSSYITLQRSDFVGVRRIVNGTDRAVLIDDYAKEYDAALKAQNYGEPQTLAGAPEPLPKP